VPDASRVCPNCGNAQATGNFCEKCGTHMPPIVSAEPEAGGASPAYGATPQGAAPLRYASQPQYDARGPSFAPPGYHYSQEKSFFGRLFDMSFQEFITPSIIKVLFIISMVIICLSVLGGIVVGFMASGGQGVLMLIGGLIFGFLMLLYVRVLLELAIVFFRIHDNTRAIARDKH
jgi:hypothetical protein